MARTLLWILAVMWIIGGIMTDHQAKSAIHQILAQISYLIGAVFIVGAEVVSAVKSVRLEIERRIPAPVVPVEEAAPATDSKDPFLG